MRHEPHPAKWEMTRQDGIGCMTPALHYHPIPPVPAGRPFNLPSHQSQGKEGVLSPPPNQGLRLFRRKRPIVGPEGTPLDLHLAGLPPEGNNVSVTNQSNVSQPGPLTLQVVGGANHSFEDSPVLSLLVRSVRQVPDFRLVVGDTLAQLLDFIPDSLRFDSHVVLLCLSMLSERDALTRESGRSDPQLAKHKGMTSPLVPFIRCLPCGRLTD